MPSSVYLRPTEPAARTTPPGLAATVVGGVPDAEVDPGAGVPIVAGGGSGGGSGGELDAEALAAGGPAAGAAPSSPPAPPHVCV
jgi:hypothetical protein